ncbi:MAG: glycoside hydrolase family 31 [Segetibacter sp.]|nr:glycoside hydrolase family 31 [Segetibacter sp.]
MLNEHHLYFLVMLLRLLRIHLGIFLTLLSFCLIVDGQKIMTGGKPGRLEIRQAGESSVRITLKALNFKEDFPFTPAVVERNYPAPVISLTRVGKVVKRKAGALNIEVGGSPLTIVIRNRSGRLVQQLVFGNEGNLTFSVNDAPVLGLGEGGPKPEAGMNWRALPVQFDRRGRYDSMQPRWQADAYGSRNPVPLLVGTDGWAIFVATPWVEVDLRKKEKGVFVPWMPANNSFTPQNHANQQLNLGKGLPPTDTALKGFYDLFVFDAHEPAKFMKDFSEITGPSVMPPKWALGYMQSHRTLTNENQMLGIVDTFREKKIPVDAVIYLGTGFVKKGWNKMQPSFEFNPEVFQNDPKDFITKMHERNVKVILHMVPRDRDKLPGLVGNIPAKRGEVVNASHIQSYWKQHLTLMDLGVDGFWPDEGDWFNLFERLKRHQLYYQGHISYNPNLRPWSLQRNGFPGIARWGGWVWSGDTESSWKTLEAQIAVGLNYSISIGPFWGTDIGGFFSTKELTGELYARWIQFASFCGSFRSHGRTWRTRLPWGWGMGNMEPIEDKTPPLQTELNNPAIEGVAKKYIELHYQLLPYNYTLAWQARTTGLPLMRALWLHYPEDENARGLATEYLWGRDILVAPVFEKGATSRSVYLPPGEWYDWWTKSKLAGGQTISKEVTLATMPVYVRAGAIIPVDPIRQYVTQEVTEPTTLKIFRGTNGEFTLYEDDGISLDYLKGKGSLTQIIWNDKTKELSIKSVTPQGLKIIGNPRPFKVELVPEGITKDVHYSGQETSVWF